MRPIRLVDLGSAPPVRSQTCYHAAARAMRDESPDTIILVRPAAPYVCVGYHQDVEREVDLEACRARGFPVYRRETGGGCVYLDGGQTFVQWVFRPESLPAGVGEKFGLFCAPIVRAYGDLRIAAEYRPVNDIHVAGRKIGGTGAARIGSADVVVGSLMFDFDREAMAAVLRVSSEKMRDKVRQGLDRYMTTLREETAGPPDRGAVESAYLERCAEALGREIRPGDWTEAEESEARDLDRLFESSEWLFRKGAAFRRGVRIHRDVRVVESAHKAPGGLIRVSFLLRDGRVEDGSISGDFTIEPASALDALEASLRGRRAEVADALAAVADVYRRDGVRSPGVGPEDWSALLGQALRPET